MAKSAHSDALRYMIGVNTLFSNIVIFADYKRLIYEFKEKAADYSSHNITV